jgi:hypothetical protein
MSRRETMRVHADRASQELECARRASSAQAASAHLALSELHLGRLREIGEARPAPALHLVRA